MEKEKKSFWQKVRNNKKFAFFIISGLVISISATVYGAAQTDSWNIGDGWMFFKTASNSEVRANASDPVDAANVATKGYVDAATGGGGLDKFTAYGATSCPAGWTVAYSGQLFGIHGGTENYSGGASIGDRNIICAGTSRTNMPAAADLSASPYGQAHADHWYLPVANYNFWNKYMDCAVCVR